MRLAILIGSSSHPGVLLQMAVTVCLGANRFLLGSPGAGDPNRKQFAPGRTVTNGSNSTPGCEPLPIRIARRIDVFLNVSSPPRRRQGRPRFWSCYLCGMVKWVTALLLLRHNAIDTATNFWTRNWWISKWSHTAIHLVVLLLLSAISSKMPKDPMLQIRSG